MTILWAQQALTAEGWRSGVHLEIGPDGTIVRLATDTPPAGSRHAILLPAPVNLHSHAFQRAMAGMTERRGPDPRDTFWTWRKLMFKFLDQLTPDDLEAIAALVQMEMLEAGYAAVAEFHYIHHRPDGAPYDDIAELSARMAAAAEQTGIGLTLLPVLYRFGGCDRRPLGPGQIRFGSTRETYARLLEGAASAVRHLPADCRTGTAPHSLRAVAPDDLAFCADLLPAAPIHLHLAEQAAEVDEVKTHLGARPIEWLLANAGVDQRWCLIHCTQAEPHETRALAASGAIVGLCPITEASLGDGIFDAARFLGAGGRFGIGSDSNIRISLVEELRTLEYGQRLRDRGRAVLASTTHSTGRRIFETATRGGATASARGPGAIIEGAPADLLALNGHAIDLIGRAGDDILDSFIFVGGNDTITDVWSAGRHLVQQGRHLRHDAITARYRQTIGRLQSRL